MIKVTQVSKEFPSLTSKEPNRVLDVDSLSIKPGEFISLLGPSGCGKTTLLRILAGLETPTSGKVYLNGNDITELPVQERPIHTVFQRYALFPHLSVFDNIAFPLKIRGEPRDSIQSRVSDMLRLVRMESFGGRYPSSLSGGQAQRVAVARALINRPLLLLLDEPFSALDPQLRFSMQKELRDLQKSLGITFLMVTHDRSEAFSLSDRIAVMKAGEIIQIDSPSNIYHSPTSLDAAQIGGNSFHLRLRGRGTVSNGVCDFQANALSLDGQTVPLNWNFKARWVSGLLEVPSEVSLIIRPEFVRLRQNLGPQCFAAQLKESFFVGDRNNLIFEVGDKALLKLSLMTAQSMSGESCYLEFPVEHTILFPADESASGA